MLDANTDYKQGNLQQAHPDGKELLKERVIYLLLVAFIVTELVLVISALWLRDWRLAVAGFMPLSGLTMTCVAALFGQKKMMELLCDIIKDLLRTFWVQKPK